ncbi:DUF1566 domain-containing protein [Thiorhodococcus mannitoliphagus]|uniref:DUF1566 domain-containing protein n=1 Tax=Thiorhodococcus mannitoliphagus TaxID=329406 RepID=A0A6P1DY10_9GAMM|nr:DUF1566 domain-containing protein [Thiorhodococcus mannitoliphagus]NEX23207.1 DUF1566 domain-containing protein [Thiorhodococcus mannitoliphagus]
MPVTRFTRTSRIAQTSRIALSLIIGAAVPLASAQPGGDHGGGRRGPPPQEALDACADLSEQDSCQFSSPRGRVEGTCVLPPREDGILICAPDRATQRTTYPSVDTGQSACYADSGAEIACTATGRAFSGQDAQHQGKTPSFADNGDGTITDRVTGLMWQRSPDTNGDGVLNLGDELGYEQALSYCEDLSLAEHSDWRLPDIKTLYSLIDFSGRDPSGYEETDTSGLIPFIDTTYFDFAYGDTHAGERIIDAQYASSTLYIAGDLLFGVNFADGRIKGYGLTMFGQEKTFSVLCVRGNEAYGDNDFVDNGDGTISDRATGLMWARDDSGVDAPDGLNWEQALAWAESRNAARYLGYSDWRLPNVKELQGLVDYERSPDTTGSAAIDPLFSATGITNEAGQADFPFYWSSTTHANWTENLGSAGAYVAFGRAMGFMGGAWVDVHGAGAQRSDPKAGDPASYPNGRGPQGDAIRIYNAARLVRDDRRLP